MGPAAPYRALYVVLAAAVLVPLATAGFAAWFAWRTVWFEAQDGVERTADAVAQYALRVLDSYRLAAERVNEVTLGLTDAEILAREAEIHERLRALVPRLPLVRSAFVLGTDGRLLVAGNFHPVPRDVSFADREWVVALRDPAEPEPHISSVHVGRVDQAMFFSVAIRRTGTGNAVAPGATEGVISISVDPNAFAAGLADLLRDRQNDQAGLVRADGYALARLPAFTAPPGRLPPDSGFMRGVAGQPERFGYRSVSFNSGRETLFANRKVPGWPVYASAARRVEAIRAEWWRTVTLQLAWGAPATLALVGTALFALFRARAAERAERSLREEAARRAAAEAREAAEARFRGVFESDVFGFAILDLATGEPLAANDRLLEMAGLPRDPAAPGGGWRWGAATAPEHAARDADALAEAREAGWFTPFDKDFLRPDGTRLPVRVASAPLPNEPGRAVVMVQDITEQREAEHRRDLLVQEVNHRAKNALATARAALRLTRAETTEAFIASVDGRIGALAQAMEALARTGWIGADLEGVVRGEMTAFTDAPGAPGPARLEVAGPPVMLAATAVQPVTMALHELATNATKHGALSAAGGGVSVTWELVGDPAAPRLRITWRERGGPRLDRAPDAKGFGSRMLRTTMERQLGGRFDCDWQAEGLVCTLDLPPRVVARVEEEARRDTAAKGRGRELAGLEESAAGD